MHLNLSLKTIFALLLITQANLVTAQKETSGNPIFKGWYADPEAKIFNKTYWIYPTYSAPYKEQVFMDAFSSNDLVNWVKHSHVLDSGNVKWVKKALWAPAITEKEGKYYLFFGANDIHDDTKEIGGIGVAVADKPEGPFKDYLGKPLIGKIYNKAQPIDQFVFKDTNGQYYITKLKNDFTGVVPFDDGITYKNITPKDYVEGPVMFKRKAKYYLMWSEGGWTGPDYRVAYAMGDTPFGPFKRIATVLKQDINIATGAGHHSVIQLPGTHEWYIVYHRRPLGETDGNHRVVCIDKMYFDADGLIKPVVITRDGVEARKLN
jgi:beta-xylosidase